MTTYHYNGKQIDLKLNGTAEPSCPNCKRYNAMLFERMCNGPSDDYVLKCRDCGAEVIVITSGAEIEVEPDLRTTGHRPICKTCGTVFPSVAALLKAISTRYCARCGKNLPENKEYGAICARCIGESAPNSDFGANKGTY
jgi:DNA-directed RNA polymerase subunit RPC12/RpoP